MSNKRTLKEDFMEVREVLVANGKTHLVDFIDGRIAQVEKKNANRSGKLTKEQKANEVYTAEIVKVLTECDNPNGMTITEIIKELPADPCPDNGWTNQKVNALVTALKKAEVVSRTEIKGKAHFSLN